MRRYLSLLLVVGLVGLFASCEEGPEQIYKPLPDDFDPNLYNGLGALAHVNTGTKDFAWTTSGMATGTAIICQADEMAKRWSDMVKKPIVPTAGAGGLDLKGEPKWAGLSIDDAQQDLCQAYMYSGLAYWGDNAELIAFYDEKTRLISRLVTSTGYYGAIEAGDYKITNNREVMFKGKALINATSDDNLKAMNTAFLKKFRPEVKNPEQRDCVATNSCYVMDWYTLKRFIFNDVMLDFAIEPEGRIHHIGLNLVRNFEFGKNTVKFTASPMPPAGLPPVPKIDANAAAAGCAPTLGSTWDHITGKCLMIDVEEKAAIQPVWSNEVVLADMGGLGLYMQRPTLKVDEVIPDTISKAQGTDVIIGMFIGTSYEGEVELSRKTWYDNYLTRVAAEVKQMLPAVDASAKLANLEPWEDDPSTWTKLRLGTQKIRDCNESPCEETTLTKRVRALVEAEIKASGPNVKVPDKILKDPNFFVEPLLRELVKMFNNNVEPTPSEIYFYPNDESAQVLYVTLLRTFNGERYAVKTAYDNIADQLYYFFFKKGAMRPEAVLFKDAEQDGDGVFRLWNLVKSPRIGLGQTMFPADENAIKPAIQKVLVDVPLTPQVSILLNYHKQDTTCGFGIPVEGKRDAFVQTAYYGFPGNVVGAAFYADETDGIIKAIYSGVFYDKLDFCGFKVGLYEEIAPLLQSLPDSCERILSFSENGKFLSGLSTYVQETPFKIGVRLWITAGRVDGAYYWAEE